MIKLARPVVALLVIGVFLITHLARPAGADDRPIKLYANAGAGPIGSSDMWSRVSINGRRATGAQMIWGGEVIEAQSDARLSIDDTAEVALVRGAIIKLARTRNSFEDDGSDMLIAQLIAGSASIRLDARAAAYVEASGASYIAKRASSFKVTVNEGRADFSVARGEVEEIQTAQRRYQLRPIGIGANLSVRARATRQIQIQVTDENNNPAPDVPVLFAVGAQGGGTFSAAGAAAATSVTVRTDRRGIATAIFTAGDVAATTTITATIPGTDAIFTASVTVSAATALLSTTTITLLAVAGGAAAGTAIVIARKNNPEDIVAQPPDVRPK
ncbi:MAG: hypothetical protein AB1631_30080 [Acidobacteriota bacterium]